MKPRKKQRIDTGDNDIQQSKKSKSERTKKIKKQEPVIDQMEESSADEEQLEDEMIEDDDDLPDDEVDIDDADDSEESEQDDFQDVKLKKRKKQSKDVASFATAMSAILSSSLKAHTRAVPPKSSPSSPLSPLFLSQFPPSSDPILARSKSHAKSLEEAKSQHRLRRALSAHRKALRSLGHVDDLSTYDAKSIEYERSMRKTAQRGVVKLFNAIRASQIKAEEAMGGEGRSGEREERVKEMSREGFLNLIKSG